MVDRDTPSAGHDRGVRAPELLRHGMRFFAAPKAQPRARRATDAILLVASLLGVAATVAVYPPGPFELSLQRLFDATPSWLDPLWGFLSDSLWLWAGALIAVSLARRRFAIALAALGGWALATAVGIVVARVAVGSWPRIDDELLGVADAARFPHVRSAAAVAVILVITPHLVRPLRRLGTWIAVLGTLGAAVAGSGTPGGTVGAFLVAVGAAAAVRLATGTSLGRPGLADVHERLAELGVEATHLAEAERQTAGVFHVRGQDASGRELLVKIYGRDAYDTQLVARLWRGIWYRDGNLALGKGRLESAEHEAFVTLLAERARLPTREVVTAAATLDGDALLVLRGEAQPFASFPPERLDETTLRDAWGALDTLAGLCIAHRQIDADALVTIGGRVGLVGFGAATVAPDEHGLDTDKAQLLITTVALVGADRALEAAVTALGREGVAALLPYLQSAAFSPALRAALRAAAVDVDDVREQAAALVSVEAPELVRLRRVTVLSAAQLALLGLATYAIISAATDVDWDAFRSTLDGASWGWVIAAFAVAQAPRLTQAISTLGSVPTALPFGPVYAMQLATGYMNVALPSNLARLAVNIRFFQRQGLSAPIAVASGTIDSFASTVAQAGLLGVLLVFSESSLAFDLSLPSGGTRTLVGVVVALIVVSAIVVLFVRRVRTVVAEGVRRWWPDVKQSLAGLRAANKLALLVLGSLATEVLFAIALGMFAKSFGYDLSLAELLVINMSVALIGSFVPIPGNIGVAELGLTIGLVSAGMTDEAALAAVLLYRIATYYLPPLWGFFALRWLQRARYL